jgi:broad specificity phosphatase PhoE
LIRADGSVARLARRQADLWRHVVEEAADGAKAMVISHGGLIEPGLVAALPDVAMHSLGTAFAHCEGVTLAYDGEMFLQAVLHRI